jgi:hypothetical protein
MAPVRFVLGLLILGMGGSLAHGQDRAADPGSSASRAGAVPDTVVQRVTTAFVDGDAQRLLSPAADRVEVSLFGTRTFYSSAQAFYVLEDFFETHPPADFEVGDVTEAGESCFLRGRFDHGRDERTLQVYVRLVRRGDVWLLQEIRIDADVSS